MTERKRGNRGKIQDFAEKVKFGAKNDPVLEALGSFYGFKHEMPPEEEVAPEALAKDNIQTQDRKIPERRIRENELLAEAATGIGNHPSPVRQKSPLVTVDDYERENPYAR